MNKIFSLFAPVRDVFQRGRLAERMAKMSCDSDAWRILSELCEEFAMLVSMVGDGGLFLPVPRVDEQVDYVCTILWSVDGNPSEADLATPVLGSDPFATWLDEFYRELVDFLNRIFADLESVRAEVYTFAVPPVPPGLDDQAADTFVDLAPIDVLYRVLSRVTLGEMTYIVLHRVGDPFTSDTIVIWRIEPKEGEQEIFEDAPSDDEVARARAEFLRQVGDLLPP